MIPFARNQNMPSLPVTIKVDASHRLAQLKPIWRFFGADEPNYATMPNGQKLIAELGALKPKSIYFRTHNLLTSGDGTSSFKWGSTNIYTEDAQGHPVYDFKIVDGIFDTYLKRGVRPYVEVGFMPEALSTKPSPYRHSWAPGQPYDAIYTGWTYPPKDFDKWTELVYRWAEHCVQRYGRREVENWYWEVWNEPNIGYFKGTREEFFRLHDLAVAAVRRALPTARVGGPDTAGAGAYFSAFLDHALTGTNYATGVKGTPLDFVSFHAKGLPEVLDGHVRMGIANQLRTMDDGFARVAAHPDLKNTPIVIGESDPDGCAACQGPQLGYRNGTLYSSYTAASFPRALELADKRGVNLEGALTWAFEFEGYSYFPGFRQLATNGVDLPVLNVFRMFSKMTGDRIEAESDGAIPLQSLLRDGVRGAPDVGVMASSDGRRLSVMVWHYHDDDVSGPDADISLRLNGLPSRFDTFKLTHYRVDSSHSNAFAAWKSMGSPASPNAAEYKKLERAGKLHTLGPATWLNASGGSASIHFNLPRQGVSLLVLDCG